MSAPVPHLAEGEVAIAHLSDLHVGAGKNTGFWENVKQQLEKLGPQLEYVFVTGDLVDTPRKKHFDDAVGVQHVTVIAQLKQKKQHSAANPPV